MDMNLELASQKAIEALKQHLKGIDFKAEIKNNGEFLDVYQEGLVLEGLDNAIYVSLQLTKGGYGFFCLTFDKLKKSAKTLEMVNRFNADNPFLKAYIHDNGHLAIENNVAIFSEIEFAEQAIEFMYRGSELAKDNNLIALAKLTVPEEASGNSEKQN